MSTVVKDILDRIQQLPEPERDELRNELARLEEAEWKELASAARRHAVTKGLDDEAIVRTVESFRYGDDAASK